MTMTTLPAVDTALLTPAAAVMQARVLTLSVRTSTFGNARKASLGAVTVESDKALLRMSKLLLDSPELDAVHRFDGQTAKLLQAKAAGPSLLRAGILPIAAVEVVAVDAWLTERAAHRQVLVDRAVETYALRRDETLLRLNVLANARDYPSSRGFRARFSFDWYWLQHGTPEALRSISPSLMEREQAKFRAELDRAAAEAQQGVREMLLLLTAHFVQKMAPAHEDGGKRKILQARTVTKLKEFLATFDGIRNTTGDAEVAPLVARLRGLLDGRDPEMLRTDASVRAHVAAEMASVLTTLQPMVVGRRLFTIEDEEDEDGDHESEAPTPAPDAVAVPA